MNIERLILFFEEGYHQETANTREEAQIESFYKSIDEYYVFQSTTKLVDIYVTFVYLFNDKIHEV